MIETIFHKHRRIGAKLVHKLIFIYCSLCIFATSAEQPQTLKLLNSKDGYHEGDSYFTDLVNLLIQQPAIKGKYKIEIVNADNYFYGKTIHLVAKGLIDLSWMGSTDAFADVSQQVKVPAVGGLLGQRLLIIKKEGVKKFKSIRSLNELKQYTACQGKYWPDSDILEQNGLPVLRVEDFNAMLKLLNAGKCDYFPRGIHESNMERNYINEHYPELTFSEDLLIHYNYAAHIYTHKNADKLTKDLTLAFQQSIENGSFLKLLKTHKFTQHVFPLNQWAKYTKIELKNPAYDALRLPTTEKLWISLPNN